MRHDRPQVWKWVKYQECVQLFSWILLLCQNLLGWILVPTTTTVIYQSFIQGGQYGTMIPLVGMRCPAPTKPNHQPAGLAAPAGWQAGTPPPAVPDYSRGCKISRIFWRCFFQICENLWWEKMSGPWSEGLTVPIWGLAQVKKWSHWIIILSDWQKKGIKWLKIRPG